MKMENIIFQYIDPEIVNDSRELYFLVNKKFK